MSDLLIAGGITILIILAVMGGMIFSFLAGARVYRAGRDSYPVNIIDMPMKTKPEIVHDWNEGL